MVRRGFTLIELLIVIIVIAVLAAIALPKFVDSGLRSKETSLKANLKILRMAYERFVQDTGAAPRTLEALTRTTAPSHGFDPDILDNGNGNQPIRSADWHGPYLDSLPQDPIANDDFSYTKLRAGIVHPIHSSSTTRSTEGTRYYTW